MNVAGLARRVLSAERIFVRRRRLQRRHDAPDRVLAKAGTDHADKTEVVAALDACHQRAELAVVGLPSAEHDFLSGAAFGLGPALRTAGTIRRGELLGNDALQRQSARRAEYRVAAGFEMFDVTDQF